MDHRPKCKRQNFNTSKTKHKTKISLPTWNRQTFLSPQKDINYKTEN